jgi:hypothetical protein
MVDRILTITLIILILAWVLTKSKETVTVAQGLAGAYATSVNALTPK